MPHLRVVDQEWRAIRLHVMRAKRCSGKLVCGAKHFAMRCNAMQCLRVSRIVLLCFPPPQLLSAVTADVAGVVIILRIAGRRCCALWLCSATSGGGTDYPIVGCWTVRCCGPANHATSCCATSRRLAARVLPGVASSVLMPCSTRCCASGSALAMRYISSSHWHCEVCRRGGRRCVRWRRVLNWRGRCWHLHHATGLRGVWQVPERWENAKLHCLRNLQCRWHDHPCTALCRSNLLLHLCRRCFGLGQRCICCPQPLRQVRIVAEHCFQIILAALPQMIPAEPDEKAMALQICHMQCGAVKG